MNLSILIIAYGAFAGGAIVGCFIMAFIAGGRAQDDWDRAAEIVGLLDEVRRELHAFTGNSALVFKVDAMKRRVRDEIGQ